MRSMHFKRIFPVGIFVLPFLASSNMGWLSSDVVSPLLFGLDALRVDLGIRIRWLSVVPWLMWPCVTTFSLLN